MKNFLYGLIYSVCPTMILCGGVAACIGVAKASGYLAVVLFIVGIACLLWAYTVVKWMGDIMKKHRDNAKNDGNNSIVRIGKFQKN